MRLKVCQALSCLLFLSLVGCAENETNNNPVSSDAIAVDRIIETLPNSVNDGGGGGGDPTNLHELLLGPVAGLTTRWHSSPDEIVVPVGSQVQIRVLASEHAVVTWNGGVNVRTRIRERGNRILQSTVDCPVVDTEKQSLEVTVQYGDGAVWTASCTIRGINIDLEDVEFDVQSVDRVFELPLNPTNEETMDRFFGSSIAQLNEVAPGSFLTSVDRPVQFHAKIDPEELAGMVEWRHADGMTVLGSSMVRTYSTVGSYSIDVGPPSSSIPLAVETYRTRITSHTSGGDKIPDGEAILFEAETIPPGYEHLITWLSSTKNGTGLPVLGSGPTFSVQFDDTWRENDEGQLSQWLGVRGDNVVFNQDTKVIPNEITLLEEDGSVSSLASNRDSIHTYRVVCKFLNGNATNQITGFLLNPVGLIDDTGGCRTSYTAVFNFTAAPALATNCVHLQSIPCNGNGPPPNRNIQGLGCQQLGVDSVRTIVTPGAWDPGPAGADDWIATGGIEIQSENTIRCIIRGTAIGPATLTCLGTDGGMTYRSTCSFQVGG